MIEYLNNNAIKENNNYVFNSKMGKILIIPDYKNKEVQIYDKVTDIHICTCTTKENLIRTLNFFNK